MSKNSKAKRDAKAKSRAKGRRSEVGARTRSHFDGGNPFEDLGRVLAEASEDGVHAILDRLSVKMTSAAAEVAADVWAGPLDAANERRWRTALFDAVVTCWVDMVGRALSGGWWPHELVRIAERAAPKLGGSVCLDVLALIRSGAGDGGAAWSYSRLDLPPPQRDRQSFRGRWVTPMPPGTPETPWLIPLLSALVPIRLAPAGAAPPPTRRSDADEAVLTKVRALLAQAESTTFEEEAAAFAAKAQQLMSRHSIDAALLARTEGEAPVLRRIAIDDPYFDAKSHLACCVANANRCSPIILNNQAMVAVVGYANDLEMVEVLFTSLLAQAISGMARANATNTGGRTRSFRHSFLIGFSDRISTRLRETDASTVAAAASEVGGSALLPVLASRRDAVDDEMARLFPSTRATTIKGSNAHGRVAGMAAADIVDLSVGTPLANAARRPAQVAQL